MGKIAYINDGVAENHVDAEAVERFASEIREGKVKTFYTAALMADGTPTFLRGGYVDSPAECGALAGVMNLFTYQLGKISFDMVHGESVPEDKSG